MVTRRKAARKALSAAAGRSAAAVPVSQSRRFRAGPLQGVVVQRSVTRRCRCGGPRSVQRGQVGSPSHATFRRSATWPDGRGTSDDPTPPVVPPQVRYDWTRPWHPVRPGRPTEPQVRYDCQAKAGRHVRPAREEFHRPSVWCLGARTGSEDELGGLGALGNSAPQPWDAAASVREDLE